MQRATVAAAYPVCNHRLARLKWPRLPSLLQRNHSHCNVTETDDVVGDDAPSYFSLDRLCQAGRRVNGAELLGRASCGAKPDAE